MTIESEKIGIINYGLGNIRSLKNCIESLNFKVQIINNPSNLEKYDKIILPGVGSFKKAMSLINSLGWSDKILENVKIKKKKILGICLGMQILLSKGYEFGETKGLNLISGEVVSLKSEGCNELLPHIGWNEVEIKKNNTLFDNIPNNSSFYFINSYVCKLTDTTKESGSTNYGLNFTSALNFQNIYGTQFHPEKSSKIGRQLLNNFLNA
jgi:glutamine amidotransferase